VTAVAGNEAATVSWTAPASDGGSPITAYTVTAEPGGATQQTGGTATSTSVGGLTNGTSYTFTVRATNAAGQGPASAPSNAVTPSAAVVTPVPPGETLDFVESIEAIYTGPGALQEGVTEGAIEPRRATLVRGGVADTDGNPLAGVQVTVLDRPELGVATSLDSGEVALVINGGGSAVLEFVKEGYLPVQRTIVTGWRDTEFLDLVMLTERDVPTTVDPDSTEPFQVVRGSEVDDAAGERQATLLYPAGTDAEMVLDDGTVVPLDALTVRATEYTVGEAGVAAMPGTLPPTTGYTYAVEFSVDEAEAAGAEMVRFSKPLVNYTENFIGAPVGSPVPTGWYDRTEGRWVPSDNGLVIAVVGRTGGLAEVDVTGDGVADSAAALAERGITDAERQRLASLYTDGTELWRVEITHFTPWDHNWPYGPPPNARPPRLRWFNDEEPDPCFTSGSVISCESQVMGEVLGVTGTSHTLHYSSDRVPGRRSAFTLDVPVTGAEPPPEVKGIRVRVEIAGRRWERIWAGSPANLSYQLTWDGLDALGNAVHGQPLATVSVAYAFEPFYYASPTEWEQSFSRFAAAGAQVFDGRGYCPPPPPPLGGGGVIGRRGRFTVAGTPDPGSAPESVLCGILLESTVRRRVGAVDARENGLGGWTVGAHHRYDPASGVLHLGTGEVETTPWITATQDSVLSRRGEAGQLAHTRLGQSATGARTDYLTDAVVAPDGTVYANECFNQCRVYRIDPDGIIHGFAGTGEKGTYSGEGGPATAAVLGDNLGPMAVAPDGTVYLATSHRINGWAIWFVRAVSPDGTIRTVAGHPSSPATFADRTQRFHGALATDARLPEINGMALAADGGLLLVHRAVDLNDNPGALRRIDAGPDPRIWVIAGGGTVTGDADLAPGGTNAAQYRFNRSRGVAVAPDGTIYIADPAARRVWAIGTDGLLRRVAGTSTAGNQWDGTGRPALTSRVGDPMNVAVAPDGTLWVRSRLSDGDLVWRLTEEAFVDHVAGVAPNTVGAPSCSFGQQQWDGTAAARVCLRTHQSALSVFPDGTAMAGDGRWGIRRFVPPLPGFTGSSAVIPSSDGTEVYEFTSGGRHLRTRDAVSGAVRLEFGYGSGGHLSTVTDAYGNVTRIERDVLGAPTAIVAPGGQRTTLTLEDGWLTRVADPMGHADRFTYDAGGLLRTHIDPTDAASSYGYDAEGHLTSATDPVEGVQTITRIAGQEALEVVHRSAEGLETRYRTTTEAAGRRRTVTDPSGAVSSTLTRTDGTVEHEAADGSRTVVGYGEDPRWGAVVPVAVSMTTSTPGQPGADPPVPPRTLSVTVERLAQYTTGDINDPFAYSELIERVTYGGASSAQATYRYNPTTRTLTRTSAGNRVVTTIFDQRGRPVSIDVPGTVDPVLLAYDSRGRPSTITQGAAAASSQVTTFTYDERNRLVSEADAAGRATTYEHDDADRVTAVHLPGGGTARFGYDEAGRRTSVTMPSGDVHELGWTPEGDPARYQAPGVAALTRSWDADGALQTITQPSGRTVAYGYDEGGRLATETTAASTTTFAYDGVTDVVAGVTNGTGPGQQTLAMDRDGDVLEGLVFGGVAQGSFAYAYNARQELTGVTLSVDGQDPVSTTLTRDSDGLITNEAGLAVTRSGPDAAPTRIADSWLRVDLTYDTLAQPTGRSLAIGGTTRYGLTVTYDRGGRISGRTENVDGTTSTWAYGRDGAGRVTEVRRNGTVVEEYTYDANGNRTSRRVGGGAVQSATYDDADRLLTQGGVTFTHHADGHVTGRGADTFSASARGDLLSATVGGTTATYTYDGLRRRTARTQGGQTEAYLYGDPANPFRITHVRAADGAVTTLRYDDGGLLVALERGGERFAVATDQVGSPRLVIAPDGTVAKRIAYDAYGVPTIELGAAFDLPIGFAGGLLDPLTGLVRFGLRDYDPAAGRWTSRDPAGYQGGQLNLYAYVDGDPVGLRDASGLGVVVGSSLFAGIGFDAEIAISSKGMSACIGVGIGTPGGSIGVKTGDPKSRSGLYTAGEVGAKVGDYGVGAGFEIDPCGMVNIEPPKAKFPGGWSIDTAGNIERSFEPPNTAPPPPKIKAQFEGKLVGRYCASTLG
jgi:RHS repeat-associated protein